MLKNIAVFDPKDTIENIIRVIRRSPETNFVVFKNKKLLGLLYHKGIIQNSDKGALLIQGLTTTSFGTMATKEELSVAYKLMQDKTHPFFPVTEKNELVDAFILTICMRIYRWKTA